MAQRRKNKPMPTKVRPQLPSAKRAAAPTLIVTAWISSFEGFERVVKTEVKLPCTLAELAKQLAEAAFAMAEELAFHAKVAFLPEKEIAIDGEFTDDDIPF